MGPVARFRLRVFPIAWESNSCVWGVGVGGNDGSDDGVLATVDKED
jgi:hypothetical protein